MIELQRRLAQDYQRQRELELNRQMAQTGIQDNVSNDQTMLVRHADVERFDTEMPPMHQTSSLASRGTARVDIVDHSDQVHPRLGQQQQQVTAASWPQPDVTGTGQYDDNRNRQQLDRVEPMPVSHGSNRVDDFVHYLKSRNAK